MKLPFKLYEQAGDSGSSGGGTGAGSTATDGMSNATGSSGSLLSGAGSASTGATGQNQGGSASAAGQAGAAAGSSPYFVGLYDSTGKIDKTKFDALPSHLKPYKDTFAKYDSVEALLTGMGNLVQLAGKKGLQPLPADAPDEAKAERAVLMRQLNNVPEKPEGYGMKKPEGLPDGVWNEEYANGVLEILHKHNAPPDLVKELFDADQQMIASQLEQAKAGKVAFKTQQLEVLKKEFGAEFDQRMELAARGARVAGLDPNDEFFGDARAVKMALKLAENTSEDRLPSGDSDVSMGGSDREKARDIVFNPSNSLHKAYHDTNDPRHDEATKTVLELNRRAHQSKRR